MKVTRTPSGLVKVDFRERRRRELRSKVVPVPMVANTYRDHDPLISEGLGCMTGQVPEMRETIRKHNIKGVRVRDSGQLEITSRQGRNEVLRMRELHDADGGFGDA